MPEEKKQWNEEKIRVNSQLSKYVSSDEEEENEWSGLRIIAITSSFSFFIIIVITE